LTTDTRPARPTRRRLPWAACTSILVTLGIVFGLKATSLNGLPDVGEPFEIEAFCRPIPDETNAFVLYKEAFEKLAKEPQSPGGVWIADWGSAGLGQRRWLEESREALRLWKLGTARPDALYVPPRTLNVMTLLPVIQGMRSFGRLAILEGTRLEAEGDLTGALGWYLAVLRSSKHCGRRGVAIERLVGIAVGSMAVTRLSALASDPRIDAATLRRALDAVVEADAMTPPLSDSFKCEYIAFLNTIAHPVFEDPAKLAALSGAKVPWNWASSGAGQACFRAERSMKREPERSRRVFRLIVANWLAYCDRPTSSRPPLAILALPANPKSPTPPAALNLFVPEATAPDSVKALLPDDLAGWFRSTIYAEILSPNFGGIDGAFKRERAACASLQIALANELYKKENGQYPEKVDALVGRYLKALPRGYVPIE
jgi:hypothetical protein